MADTTFTPDEILLDGIYTDNYPVRCRKDKAKVKRYGYKSASVTIDRWLDCHSQGYLFIPGTMQSFYDPQWQCHRYTHAEALWMGTQWLVLDLDRDDDGFRLHDPAHLLDADPLAESLLYAVLESVSSLIEHRGARFHGFALCQRQITNRQEYDALMLGLQSKLTLMTGAGRQPAQPVYGNARPHCYKALFEAILTNDLIDELTEIGYQIKPELHTKKPQARDYGYRPGNRSGNTAAAFATDYTQVKDETLQAWLADYKVDIYTGAKYQIGMHAEIHYLPCPFTHAHSESIDGPTDACITVRREDGSWGFKCFHEHCVDRHWEDFRDAMTCPVRNILRTQNQKPTVEHTLNARAYRDVRCPTCQQAGDAIYNTEQQRGIYACRSGCPPIPIQNYGDER